MQLVRYGLIGVRNKCKLCGRKMSLVLTDDTIIPCECQNIDEEKEEKYYFTEENENVCECGKKEEYEVKCNYEKCDTLYCSNKCRNIDWNGPLYSNGNFSHKWDCERQISNEEDLKSIFLEANRLFEVNTRINIKNEVYSEEELSSFESEFNFVIPKYLRLYLLYCSKYIIQQKDTTVWIKVIFNEESVKPSLDDDKINISCMYGCGHGSDIRYLLTGEHAGKTITLSIYSGKWHIGKVYDFRSKAKLIAYGFKGELCKKCGNYVSSLNVHAKNGEFCSEYCFPQWKGLRTYTTDDLCFI